MDKLEKIFETWWFDLTQAERDDKSRDRASVAQLKRLSLVEINGELGPDVVSAFEVERFQTLRNKIACYENWDTPPFSAEWKQEKVYQNENALVIAAYCLAHLKQHSTEHPATTLGYSKSDKKIQPKLNEAFFKSFNRTETDADLFNQARRLSKLLDADATNVGILGASLYLWRRSPSVRRDWARHYYGLDRNGQETPPASASADI